MSTKLRDYIIGVIESEITTVEPVDGTTEFIKTDVNIVASAGYDFSFFRKKGSTENLVTEFEYPLIEESPCSFNKWLQKHGADTDYDVTIVDKYFLEDCPYMELIDGINEFHRLYIHINTWLDNSRWRKCYAPDGEYKDRYLHVLDTLESGLKESQDEVKAAYREALSKAVDLFKGVEAGLSPW